MDVRLSVRPGQECAVVEVAGDLDMATSPRLLERVQAVLDAGTPNVVVDLTAVGFMDSSGLGALVVMFKAAAERGGRLCVAAAQRPVRSVLAITSVDQAIEATKPCPRPRRACRRPWPD
ncbi:MAG TPA: STAS domain-containing protein [Actinoplanes sp.]|nr:STAS domain-containing protein [Actinoplanes sp.]